MMKAQIPVKEADEVEEAKQQRSARNYKESKEDSGSLLNKAHPTNRQPAEKVQPAKSVKIASRNQRVNVQYADGSVKKDVKFKTVEEDLKSNKCVIIE